MNGTILPIIVIVPIFAALVAVIVWIGTTIYRRYTGLTRGQSALLFLASVSAAACLLTYESQNYTEFSRVVTWRSGVGSGTYMQPYRSGDLHAIRISFCTILFPLLVIPFAIQLYRKWIGSHLTEAEKMPDTGGVRAWLGVGNVLCAALIPVCVNQLFDLSFIAMITLTFGLLLAYPLLNIAARSAQPAAMAPAEDLSSEREKVLQLLEAGKITADESAELLNALGHTAARPQTKPAGGITAHRKIILLGAALLLIGFFLPWISVNTAEETSRLQSQLQQNTNQQMPATMNLPTFSQPGWTIRLCGGDIAHGLGWWILLLGVAAAVLPFFATNLSGEVQKKVTLGCLGVGAVILIYLFTNNIRFVSVGILFGLAGYVLELIGTLQERPVAD
jgi:hypothetical protein